MTIELSRRLSALTRIIERQHARVHYQILWDCCCDHGLLGRHFLAQASIERVHFVDRVSDITARLSPMLREFGPSRYQLLTQDAATLTLDTESQHLIVIAGIGGELATHILQTLVENNPHAQVDFLLCPNNAIFNLRDYLAAGPFNLLHEQLIRERKWFYEAILVSKGVATTPVSVTGEFWNEGNKDHVDYMQRLVGHLHSLTKSKTPENAKARLNAYNLCFK
ncbi:tRNA (adenine(22)-N(1))-methyltransferase TrmK [Simiduia sp. 21SJ11W-1]|uniref:tRNA (adenine(22)-N(1))-methyltransferase TrmK n=1 Tax=Simiduia sp. 21SJ11W-1 TaxID=2909669 RepID=UPI00209CC4B1|nr:tRNA (adenine(22)-N(1))-methyltransferase TrmK [Simiduia sp. 21SJ11W-1]UTA47082.1 tRNA (adenine(22)-N(1))-methyltransferase TrmK [Simiduia sp. 21SJ11W-1]